MVMNVKIDAEVHRQMSIKAAELQVHKNVLASALIECGLTMTDEAILQACFCVTSDAKTECPNPVPAPKSQPGET